MGKGGRKGEVWCYLRKLEALQKEVGIPGEAAPEPEVDMSHMTKYEKGRYQVAKTMADLRKDITALDDLESGGKAEPTQKALLSNRIRKQVNTMKSETAALRKVAESEGKTQRSMDGGPSDYDELMKHMKRTEDLWKQRFRRGDGSGSHSGGDDDDGPSQGGRQMKSIQDLKDQTSGGEPMINPADDEEFQVFYEQTKERDLQIDEALDRVHAGIGRLKQNAYAIKDELKEQNELLDDINTKADKRLAEMKTMNHKLKETLEEVKKDKMCCYLICCLMLLGIMGVIVSYTGILGGGDD